MWNHSKSLLLTAVWIRVALLAWIIIAVALPFWQQSRAVLVLFYFIFSTKWTYFPSGAAGFVWIGQTAAETSTGAGVLRGKSRFTAPCELDVFFRCGISFGGGLPVARFDTGGRRRRVSGPVCAGGEKSIG